MRERNLLELDHHACVCIEDDRMQLGNKSNTLLSSVRILQQHGWMIGENVMGGETDVHVNVERAITTGNG